MRRGTRRSLGLLVGLTVLLPPAALAQSCAGFIYFKNNSRFESLTVDDKGATKERQVTHVTDATASDASAQSVLDSVTYDGSGRETKQGKSTARCQGGDLHLDFTGGLPAQEGKVQGEPVFLRYPASLQVGQALESNVKFDLQGQKDGKPMRVGFKLTDRQVAGRERIESAFGAREAFKITSVLAVSFKILGIDIPMQYDLVEYYVPGLGVIQSDTLQKGKLVERSRVRVMP